MKPQLACTECPELLFSAVTEGISPYSAGGMEAQGQGGRWGTQNFAPPALAFHPNSAQVGGAWRPLPPGLAPQMSCQLPTVTPQLLTQHILSDRATAGQPGAGH